MKVKVPQPRKHSEWDDLAALRRAGTPDEIGIETTDRLWQIVFRLPDGSLGTQLTKGKDKERAIAAARQYISPRAVILSAERVPTRINTAYAGYLDEQQEKEKRLTRTPDGTYKKQYKYYHKLED